MNDKQVTLTCQTPPEDLSSRVAFDLWLNYDLNEHEQFIRKMSRVSVFMHSQSRSFPGNLIPHLFHLRDARVMGILESGEGPNKSSVRAIAFVHSATNPFRWNNSIRLILAYMREGASEGTLTEYHFRFDGISVCSGTPVTYSGECLYDNAFLSNQDFFKNSLKKLAGIE